VFRRIYLLMYMLHSLFGTITFVFRFIRHRFIIHALIFTSEWILCFFCFLALSIFDRLHKYFEVLLRRCAFIVNVRGGVKCFLLDVIKMGTIKRTAKGTQWNFFLVFAQNF
jgi:hypothetical protein